MDILNIAVVVFAICSWGGLLVGAWFWLGRLFRRLDDERGRSISITISVGAGTFMLMVAVGAASCSCYFIAFSDHALGTVIEIVEKESEHDGKRSSTYSPRVRFETSDGRENIFVPAGSSHPPQYLEGDVVPVLYHPANPSRVRLDRFGEHWLLAIHFGAFGVAWTHLTPALSLSS